MRGFIIAALSLSLTPAPALAEKKADQSADMGDSSRIICEKVEIIGSRLAVKKTCHTAAEWADIRRQQRMQTDRIQGFKPCQVGGGGLGCAQ
ncbi:hypothetical protein [Sphingosinicella humi]|uniref:Nuclease n=1 Tax=Allosphingosinicella humi TaxID=2068657 RepID=A0A2U2J4T8_9SPHN|nr:hypothetical protein [Sphingosinicella humi]PWG03322.1 hypothetical protein DF286_10920 [Sphingosinicella humi]